MARKAGKLLSELQSDHPANCWTQHHLYFLQICSHFFLGDFQRLMNGTLKDRKPLPSADPICNFQPLDQTDDFRFSHPSHICLEYVYLKFFLNSCI